jgi:hypothetical protein
VAGVPKPLDSWGFEVPAARFSVFRRIVSLGRVPVQEPLVGWPFWPSPRLDGRPFVSSPAGRSRKTPFWWLFLVRAEAAFGKPQTRGIRSGFKPSCSARWGSRGESEPIHRCLFSCPAGGWSRSGWEAMPPLRRCTEGEESSCRNADDRGDVPEGTAARVAPVVLRGRASRAATVAGVVVASVEAGAVVLRRPAPARSAWTAKGCGRRSRNRR